MIYEFISIDPGVKYAAWAQWVDGLLQKTGMGPLQDLPGRTELAVVERPRFRKDHPARAKDIEALIESAHEIGLLYKTRIAVYPEDWKGQVPKKIHQARIIKHLMESELSVIPSNKAAQKHILDAVGIGLWHLGRLK